MTTDIRTAAQREVERQNELHPESPGQDLENAAFVAGAAWGAARVTPTREAIAAEMKRHHFSANLPDNIHYGMWMSMCECGWESPEFHYPGESVDAYYAHAADAMLALMQELAEGGSNAGH